MNEFEGIDTSFARLYFAHTKEVQLIVEIDGVICNIAAITGIEFDTLKKRIMCVGLEASLSKAQRLYDMACEGNDIMVCSQ